MTDAKIEKVMTSNLLYTLFFTDGSSLEIYKSQFQGRRHVRNPAGRTDGRKHCFPDISQRKGSQGKNPLTIIHQPN